MDDPRKSLLTASILRTVSVYAAVGALLFAVLAWYYRFDSLLIVLFAASQLGYHSLLAGLLVMMKRYFRPAGGGGLLSRVNLANRVSLVRISLVPLISCLIVAAKTIPVNVPLLGLLAIAFASDALDGYLARKRRETTQIGKMLDSSSDYAILFTVSLALAIHGALPLWLFIMIAIRLFLQAIGMFLLHRRIARLHPESTLMGKVTVATLMPVLILETVKFIRCFCLPGPVFVAAELLLALILAVSCVDKLLFFKRAFRELAPHRE